MENIEALEKRIREQMSGLIKLLPEDACWVDGEKCPFGFPRGRFDQRPISFCVAPSAKNSGCNKLLPLSEVIEDMVGEIKLETKTAEIENEIEKQKVTLESEVRAVADSGDFTEDEKKIVNLASDLIKRHELKTFGDEKSYIVRVDNL
ncbi:MAG: hypothetical protein Q8Q06_03860 [bacterium]|nr:hypothetical protein [bacterium]